jgi:hypothetical protein
MSFDAMCLRERALFGLRAVGFVGLGWIATACSQAPAPVTSPAVVAEAAPAASPAGPATEPTQPPAAEPAASQEVVERLPERAQRTIASGSAPLTPVRQTAGIEPPDGVWLTDEFGNDFYVEKMKRYEGKYRFINEKRINYLGVEVDLVDADEDWFYVKVYRVTEKSASVKRTGPTAEEKEAVAQTYAIDIRTSDRLTFRRFDRGLPEDGQWRNGFVLADMNDDGFPDIVHAPPRKAGGVPVILLGDGKGGWTPWREITFPRSYDYGDIGVADFNGDGHQDMVLAIHLRGLRVLVNDGRGNFREWSEGVDYEVPGQGGEGTGFSSRTVAVVDWNKDKRPDFVALGEGPRAGGTGGGSADAKKRGVTPMTFVSDGPVVFLNQGNGKWVKQDKGTGPRQIFGDSLAIGDFNADGRPDFVTGTNRMMRKDLVNLGGTDGDWTAIDVPEVRTAGYVRAVAAADLNRDGRSDLVVAYINFELATWRAGIDVLLSQPNGAWLRQGLMVRESRVAISALAVGDVDGDKALDILATDYDGGAYVFLGDGRGSFTAEASPELQRPRGLCRGYRIQADDLDGDRRAEAVFNFADEADAVYDPDRCPSEGGMAAFKAFPNKG